MQALLRRLEEIQRGRGVQQPAPQARPGLDPREMLYQQQQRPAYARPVEEDSPYDDEEVSDNAHYLLQLAYSCAYLQPRAIELLSTATEHSAYYRQAPRREGAILS